MISLLVLTTCDSYNDKMLISGVIYMNDISQKRMYGSTRMNLEMFNKLCGRRAFSRVVMATTQWDNLPAGRDDIGEQRQQELSGTFWKSVMDEGATVMPIRKKPQDQHKIMAYLLEATLDAKKRKLDEDVLQIQKEIVDMEKYIPATEAGRQLKFTIEELIKLQKASHASTLDETGKQELEQKTKLLKDQLATLKLSLGQRIRDFFGW